VVLSLALCTAGCSAAKDDAQTGVTSAADPVADAEARVAAAEDGVTTAQDAFASAQEGFCGSATGYVETLDRYGRVFTDRKATVGDVQTLGDDLVEPRDEVVAAADAVDTANGDVAAAQQELVDAQAALAAAVASASSMTVSTAAETTVTTSTLVPPATVKRVQQAEDDLASAARGITAETPLLEAGAAYNSAALALEIAWLKLLDEAGCLSTEQQSAAVAQLTAYTTTLQTNLQRAGYDPGPIDGIYGPLTTAAVQKLQTDSGLPATGFVDEATARALQDKLDAVGQQEAAQAATQTTTIQTVLSLTGFWDGPIDGQWTDELTKALTDFQTALGVEPTGQVDAPTLAAFQQALAALQAAVTSMTATTAPPTSPGPATVTVTETTAEPTPTS